MELSAQDLTCERGGRIVFRSVSLSLKPGQLMQLTGPNGSGKSSLLRLIAGLNESQTGSVTLAGGSEDLSIGQQAHYVAHQEPVKGALSVFENLAFWRDFLGGGDVDEALEAFNLSRLSSYPAGLLSAGQKRRLALARLVLVPRVLWLLDEPTVGLDTASLARLVGVMAAQLDQGGMIIAATHVPLGREPDVRLDLGGAP
ncbi:heme ABC exporter ATP-binding protein CcmA [Aestuariivirga litoralis]|uniref:Heme ABC exporter ATP-binding protein CcmA n=1 Tax=Aestuariivirga litoralis TaxID=2650924 RepID=A0A2W2BAN8_9HYPH|nr:heme ABC exporter ATP-binding protein CcmA [Aestuariivirga litoralis]PZF77168.1 heme ABC exporter ATP-binding protein CcmA [Aestuariivirga litoralis]